MFSARSIFMTSNSAKPGECTQGLTDANGWPVGCGIWLAEFLVQPPELQITPEEGWLCECGSIFQPSVGTKYCIAFQATGTAGLTSASTKSTTVVLSNGMGQTQTRLLTAKLADLGPPITSGCAPRSYIHKFDQNGGIEFRCLPPLNCCGLSERKCTLTALNGC